MDERLRLHFDSLARLVEFTKFADAKAVPLLVLHTALIGILATKSGPLLGVLQEGPRDQQTALAVLLVFYLGATITTMILAARVFVPITQSFGESLIYFQDIAGVPYQLFLKRSQALSPETIELELLHQVFYISNVVSTKMYRVRWAFMSTIPAVLFWLILLAWGSI